MKKIIVWAMTLLLLLQPASVFAAETQSVLPDTYCVSFQYDGGVFSIPGGGSIRLSELFQQLMISRPVSQVQQVVFSDSSLLSVTAEDGDWLLTSLQFFSTEETLTVTFAEETLVITVTDDQSFVIYDKNGIFADYILTAQVANFGKVGWDIYFAGSATQDDLTANATFSDDYEADNFYANTVQSSFESDLYWFYARHAGGPGDIADGNDGKHSILHTGVNMFTRQWVDVFAVSLTNYSNPTYCTVRLKESVLSRGYERRVVKVYANGTLVGQWSGQFPNRLSMSASDLEVVNIAAPYVASLTTVTLEGGCYRVDLHSRHTVTWKNYDGTVLETDTNMDYGATPSYNGATPSRPQTSQYSYSFSGWSPSLSSVTADIVYTAQFTETTRPYALTGSFYSGLGQASPASQNILYGQSGTITFTANPGYKIDYLMDNGTKVDITDASTYTYTVSPVTGPRNVVAYGKADTYTVRYQANGGANAPDPQTKTYDIPLSLSAQLPTHETLVFAGWNTAADGSGTVYQPEDIYTANQDLTLFAQWISPNSSLTIEKTGAADENQSFVFSIVGEGLQLQVVILGNGSITLEDLPAGSYTVTEDTSWSWRYTPEKTQQQTTIPQGGSAQLTFRNTQTNSKWFQALSWLKNFFGMEAVGSS